MADKAGAGLRGLPFPPLTPAAMPPGPSSLLVCCAREGAQRFAWWRVGCFFFILGRSLSAARPTVSNNAMGHLL